MISIAIADDHRLFTEGLASALATQPDMEVRWFATSGAETEDAMAEEPVDVLLLDWEMPGTRPALLIQRLASQTCIIVVTMHATPDVETRARSAGALGLLPKSAPLTRLAPAIRAVASGLPLWDAPDLTPYIAPDLANRLLTPRELEVLAVLVSGVTTTEELARDLFISKKTVKNHLANIYAKLGVSDRAQAVVEAQRLGIGPAPSPPGVEGR